jgi:predicted permease
MKRGGEERARRIYRLLLRAYPAEHRARWGAEMEDAFLTLLARDARYGTLGRLRCWAGAAWDAALGGASARIGTGSGSGGRAGSSLGNPNGTGGREMMGTVWSDIRYAVRALARRPVLALTAVLTIALGIGANAAIFTVVDGFLFTPLPYEEPEELVTLWTANPPLGWDHTDVNPADAWDWRARATTLADLAVFYEDGLNLTGDGPPELVAAVRMTPNTLGLLGRAPALGRDFAEGEVGEGRDGLVILQDGFWERRFARDPAVLGSTLTMDGRVFTVVGVMPPDFRFLDELPDVLIPLDLDPATAERGGHFAEALARLTEGATLEQARAELVDVAAQLQREHPDTNENWTVEVYSTHAELVGDIARQASIVLMGAVGFVLLMACVNVANLLLARAGARSREMAVRAALGAGRGRVLRQLLTESVVLAVLGGGLGLVLAFWGYRAIVAALPSSLPPVFRFAMDGSVLAFVAVLTLASALLFGVAPALRSAGPEMSSLRDGGRGGRGRRASRLGSTLVVLQTAMAVVLLVGGGLLVKSIAGMRSKDFGFDPGNVLTLRLAPPATEYPEEADLRTFWRTVEDRARTVPGVVAVGSTQSHPLMGSNWGEAVTITGGDGTELRVRLTHASPGLFEALGFRVVQGRAIGAGDTEEQPMVAVVNETFVRRYLGEGADPLSTSLDGREGAAPVPIVGVIHDVVERSIDEPPEPALYLSSAHAVARTRSLVVRTAGPPEEIVPALQQAVWSLDAKMPLFEIETMEALVERRVGSFAVIANLMGAFALLSLVLGGVGIYGVTAYAAGQRTAEIGVRMAMGAERRELVRMLVIQGGRRAVLGLAIGLVAALALTAAMGSILVGVSPRDPVTFATVTGVLAGVSLLALWLPARRATRVDPVRALAAE